MFRQFKIAWVWLVLGMVLCAPLFCDAAEHDEDGDHACACACHSSYEAAPAEGMPVPQRAMTPMTSDEARPSDGVPPAIFHPPIV